MGAYTQYGPFTNGSAPGISQAFLNALETFLLGLSSASYDSNITSDGTGNITAVGTIQFLSGKETLKSHTGIVVVDFSGNTDLSLNAPNSGGSHHVYIKIGGTNMMRFDSNGNATMLGTLTQSGTP